MRVARTLALAAVAALTLHCATLARGDAEMEQLALGGANTPAEHQQLAAYYRKLAGEARAARDRHKTMAAEFPGRFGARAETRGQMRRHCERIESAQESLAQEYDEMATLHEQEAKESPQTPGPTKAP